jgi:hypothetical protein
VRVSARAERATDSERVEIGYTGSGMHRGVVVLVLGLLLLGASAPGLEALSGCPQTCEDDDVDSRCTQDACCSCCLHTGPAMVGAPTLQPPLRHSAPADLRTPVPVPSADPRDLLHVPKASLL